MINPTKYISSMLNYLLNKTKTAESKLANVGTYYVGTTITSSVPSGTATDVMQITLPAGTYVIMSSAQWTSSFTSAYAHQLLGFQNDIQDLIARTTGSGGGGSVITAVAKLTAQRTIRASLSQGSGSTLTANRLNLTAVRIA